MKIKQSLAIIFIFLGVIGFMVVLYRNSRYSDLTRPFSSYSLLSASWEKYKDKFINEGRVIDIADNNVTTSEGQSYALLRSVWIDDKKNFDAVWNWTNTNLKRKNDNLFGWRWGQREDKSFGILNAGGENTATDADTDIALALIMADRRWGIQEYLNDALKILNDIWFFETEIVEDKRYVIAGNWARDKDKIVLNPSYFAPYAYKIFAEVDSRHDWNSLVKPAYEILSRATAESLDKNQAKGLPPDWVVLDRKSGHLSATAVDKLTTNYSFDAIRIPMRVYLDYYWYKSEDAENYLKNSFHVLTDDLKNKGKLGSVYAHDGSVLNDAENPSMYATSLGFLLLQNKDLARKIYEEKIIKLYSNNQNTFLPELPYYDQNLLWFGAAIYNNKLIKI